MRIVFAGTPDFAAATFARLHADGGHDFVAAYTRPDRRKGRGRKDPGVSPVKAFAVEHGVPVEQPARWDDDAVARLRAYKADLAVVMAYGVLLPPAALDAVSLACVNVHLSLLPRWRGAAPVARAILAADAHTGVSLMRMDAGLDTGAVVARRRLPINAGATAESLYPELAELGAAMTLDFLRSPHEALAQAQAQDDAQACRAPRLRKDEARVQWSRDARDIDRQIRAFIPWPVARTSDGERDILLRRARVRDDDDDAPPGTVLSTDDGIRVQCGRGQLVIRRLQLAGGRVMSAREFMNGRQNWPAGRLE